MARNPWPSKITGAPKRVQLVLTVDGLLFRGVVQVCVAGDPRAQGRDRVYSELP